MSASDKVLNTPELLEITLLNLSLKQLLRVQPVRQQWKKTIEGSIKLQRNLFLHPVEDDTVWLVDIANLPSQQRLPKVYPTALRVKAAVSRKDEAFKKHHGPMVTPVRFNPLFEIQESGRPNLSLDAKAHLPLGLLLVGTYSRLLNFKDYGVMDVFVTQPPVRRVTVAAAIHEKTYSCYEEDMQVRAESGVRVKHLVAAVESFRERSRPEMVSDTDEVELVVQIPGALVPDEDDEALVKERTQEWKDDLATATSKGVAGVAQR